VIKRLVIGAGVAGLVAIVVKEIPAIRRELKIIRM
jgi:hypothetical protein